jgi:hypothetical protein
VDAPALAVAAATPFHRAAALDLLAQALAGSRERGRVLIEARVAVARLQGRCAAAAALLRHHRQPEQAIAAAELCAAAGTEGGPEAWHEADLARHVAGLAWMDLGEYGRASEAFASIRGELAGPGGGPDDSGPVSEPPSTLDVCDALSRHALAHLLVGSWRRAEMALIRLGELSESSGNRAVYTCMAEAAAVRGGRAGARDLLENRTRSSRIPACALLAAGVSQGEDRRAWLDDPGVAWHVYGADARGKRLHYLRLLMEREGDGAASAGLDRAGGGDTLRLLASGLPGGDPRTRPCPRSSRPCSSACARTPIRRAGSARCAWP